MPDKKRITYIFGAGATQAEVNLRDPAIRILMGDIKDSIQIRIREDGLTRLLNVANELADDTVDVEHLISLYESSGSQSHLHVARELRRLFREEIQKKIQQLGNNFNPKLLSALLDMHTIDDVGEELRGILTLNYDGLIESAIHNSRGGVNYGITINCKHSQLRPVPSIFPLLKLHGSFNWKNEFPVCLIDESELAAGEEHLWIPPGVEKKREKYPFSMLWAMARELLLCDTLRVIGCSLSRNDWELISIMYATQNLHSLTQSYDIELIDYANKGLEIKASYGYLKMKTLLEIPDVRDYLTQEVFGVKDKDTIPGAVIEYVNTSNTKVNIFELWLKAKGDALKKKGVMLTTPTNDFLSFLDEA